MQKKFSIVFTVTLVLMPLFFFALCGCKRDKNQVKTEIVLSGFEENAYINSRSFQNPDKSWGFTIFVNSMPYRHYSKIPFKNASGGFVTRKEADAVAALFIKFIKEGNSSPKLNKRTIDTLRITLN